MYLENDLKWNKAPLLNFISLIPTKINYVRLQLSTHSTDINKHPDEKDISSKPAYRVKQQAENKQRLRSIRLEVSTEKINHLLKHKQICAADIRCLDSNSKQCLANLCLQNCLLGGDS